MWNVQNVHHKNVDTGSNNKTFTKIYLKIRRPCTAVLYIAETINNAFKYGIHVHSTTTLTVMDVCVPLSPNLFPVHPLVSLYPFMHPTLSIFKVIEEIVEMMENSPDPGETEEEDEEEGNHCSSRTNPSLLEEIRQLSQASNNNCSYEGKPETRVSSAVAGLEQIILLSKCSFL